MAVPLNRLRADGSFHALGHRIGVHSAVTRSLYREVKAAKMRQVEMIAGKHFSRRTLLRGAGMPFALLHAMQEAPPHSLEPLLNGSGMVRIPAGEFLMGSRNGVADEQPVHPVRITRGFEMGKFEV